MSALTLLGRLLAFTIAVGAADLRAPHALRAWVDTAGDVVAGPSRNVARKVARRGHGEAPSDRPRRVPAAAAFRPPAVAEHADSTAARSAPIAGLPGWPAARSGRDVLAYKRSLLI